MTALGFRLLLGILGILLSRVTLVAITPLPFPSITLFLDRGILIFPALHCISFFQPREVTLSCTTRGKRVNGFLILDHLQSPMRFDCTVNDGENFIIIQGHMAIWVITHFIRKVLHVLSDSPHSKDKISNFHVGKQHLLMQASLLFTPTVWNITEEVLCNFIDCTSNQSCCIQLICCSPQLIGNFFFTFNLFNSLAQLWCAHEFEHAHEVFHTVLMPLCCNNSIHIVIGLAKVLCCTLSWQ